MLFEISGLMARQRPKFGFDGEEEGWIFVKKQRIIIVLPSLPLHEHLNLQKPATTSQLQVELRDGIADTQESGPVHTVVPSLPLLEHFTLQKPVTSQSQAELRDGIPDTHETTPALTMVVPSLPVTEHCTLQKPITSQSQAELRADTHETTLVHKTLQKPATSQSQAEFRAKTRKATLVSTEMPPLPVTEPCILQKPAASQSQAELRAKTRKATLLVHAAMPSLPVIEHCTLQTPETSQSQAELRTEMHKATIVHTAVPSHPVTEHCTLQKPAASQSQADFRAKTRKATNVHAVTTSLPVIEHCTLQKPVTSQSQAELRAETQKAALVHTVVPSLPVTEYSTLQKPAASQSQAELRDFVMDTHETTNVHTLEPEACPDFTSVDKPEIVMDPSLTTRKAPAPRRSLQDCRMNSDRRAENHRSRTGHKPIMFPRVMCSSVVMDNEKLRMLNLERKVERAGGLNKWVGSIGLGREFERMLKGQRMSKFQVANLTMEKLKQMGALAVGPRRKLIHAIGCVYHPHCLRASFN
ncbi:hypothetical protein V5N11_017333 [Cardamine amara subsp. amara]|uniref:SAM domain-containing protein n=1 Tax=Cardamine amara subsp. amara TaxID=228776 RepID=A0ABD1AD63_CARAN